MELKNRPSLSGSSESVWGTGENIQCNGKKDASGEAIGASVKEFSAG